MLFRSCRSRSSPSILQRSTNLSGRRRRSLHLVAQQMWDLLFWSSWLEVQDEVGIYTPSQTSHLKPLQKTGGRIIRVKWGSDYLVSVIFRLSYQISSPNIRSVPESRVSGASKSLGKISWRPDYPALPGTGISGFPGQKFSPIS